MGESGLDQPPAPLVGILLGRYRLQRLLGSGGMGSVYAAQHEDLGKWVAVKTLHERYVTSEQVQARFVREGRAASRIRHPAIVDVYDVGTGEGRAYLVMELLEGESLARLLNRDAPLSVRRAADLLLPVISGLAAAHDQGVMHRDLKPENIFIANERSSIQPKILDFGISKVQDEGVTAALTGTGVLVGTPFYMSPEQARAARDVDARTDQYSVGVMLYECTTGRRPVEEESLYPLIQRIVHGDFAPPRQVNPGLPAAFERVILRAMATEATERFPTTRALGRALLDFASERVRANYADEFAHDTLVQVSSPASVSSASTPQLDTTLGESVHARDTPRRSSKGWPLIGLLALVLGGASVLLWQRAERHETPPSTSAEAAPASANSAPLPVAVKTPPREAAPPTPKPAQKRVTSDPPGALVSIAGKPVGTTPLSIEVPVGTKLDVELVLPGFELVQREVSPGDPDEIQIPLTVKRVPSKRPPNKGVPAAPSRPELAPR